MAKIWTIVLSAAAILAGCQTKLETGYAPAKLGTLTPAERRGLYAQDFTLEARAAQADQASNKDDNRTRVPGGQY